MTFDLNNQPEFSPEKGSRQVEYTLWGAVSLFTGLFIFIPGYFGEQGFWAWALFVFFVVAALSVSLNNWNLRHTKIKLSPKAISHFSKLREVKINWEDITRVQVHPGRLGDKIVVHSNNAAFFFETLGEVKVKDIVKERSGFEHGDAILTRILEKVGFLESERKQATSYYYYSRNK